LFNLFFCKDFYFIARGKNSNAGGKLYIRYKNSRSRKYKKQKLSSIAENNSLAANDVHENDYQFQEALKTVLNRDCADWQQVCENWEKTFVLRQKDLKQLDSLTFFQHWTKFGHAKVFELVKLSF